MEKEPKMPENQSTKLLEENRKKEVSPSAQQTEILWVGYIKGTHCRVLRFQENEKTPPEVIIQTWIFSRWENCTNSQQIEIIVESYRKLQALLKVNTKLEELENQINATMEAKDTSKNPAKDSRVVNFELPTEDELSKTMGSKPKRSYGYGKPEDGGCGV